MVSLSSRPFLIHSSLFPLPSAREAVSVSGQEGDVVPESRSQSPVLLTLESVLRIKDERDSVAREHEALGKQLEALNAKLSAAALFMPPEMQAALAADGGGEDDASGGGHVRKWAPVLLGFLRESEHGLTTADIKEKLEGHPLEQDIGAYGGALYNALRKMVSKGELKKDGDYYCLSWQTRPPDAAVHERGVMRPTILQVIADQGPIKSADIVKYIMDHDLAPAHGMKRSTGAFFKALSVLVTQGKVIKEGKLYRVPFNENEPHDGGTSHGSDAGSVGARSGVFG